MTKKFEMSALQTHELLKKKEISASEILESSIERIEEVDGDLNALPERCFARAEKSQIIWIKIAHQNFTKIFLVFL